MRQKRKINVKHSWFAFALVFAFVCAGQAQQPMFNPATGTLTWTISEDTTQQMYGCPGNNYNAEGQCNGTMQWYYHTGKVALTITDLRTGKSSTSSQTIQGGVATASVSLNVQPGDVINYTETQQVYCPVVNQWQGINGEVGQLEVAYTRAIYLGSWTTCQTDEYQVTRCNFKVDNWCTAGTVPPDADYDGQTIWDLKSPAYGFWDTYNLCYRPSDSDPWICAANAALGLKGQQPQASCTYNP